MAEVPERLGTSASALGPVDVVQKASGWAVISTITICNTLGTAQTYTLSTSDTLNTHDGNAYLAFEAPVGAKDTIVLTGAFVLNTTGSSSCSRLVSTVSNPGVRVVAFGMTGP